MRTIVLVCTVVAAVACGGNAEEEKQPDGSAINQPAVEHCGLSCFGILKIATLDDSRLF